MSCHECGERGLVLGVDPEVGRNVVHVGATGHVAVVVILRVIVLIAVRWLYLEYGSGIMFRYPRFQWHRL